MIQSVPNAADTSQLVVAKKLLSLENQLKSGASWFFWIAGLSVLNTILYLTGAGITFALGLGVTQIIDVLASMIAAEVSAGAASVLQAIALGLDFGIAGIFVLFGVLGRKRINWAIVTGMVLYAGDGLICLLFQEWLGAVFHCLALWGLFHGFKAINELARFEASLSVGDMATVQQLAMAAQAPAQAKPPTSWSRFGMILLLILVVVVVFAVAISTLPW